MKDQKSPLFQQIDHLIRSGSHAEARGAFLEIEAVKLPRNEWAEYASFARRLSLPRQGLQLLFPIIRPSERKSASVQASEKEKAEYAALLIREGATSEALVILNEIDAVKNPEVLLYQSFALTSLWQSEAVARVLLQYLKTPELDPYQALIAKVNLAQAYVTNEDAGEAESLLRNLLDELDPEKQGLLRANALEMLGHLYWRAKKFKESEKLLEEAAELLKDSGVIDALFVEKEKALLEFAKSKGKNREHLDQVRKKAAAWPHPETLRDCDYHEAILKRDQSLAAKLVAGTRHPFYQERVRRHFAKLAVKNAFSLEEKQGAPNWQISGKTSSVILDLQTGFIEGSEEFLKTDQVLHRFLKILAEDFYRPLRLYEIHEKLFPGDYYNPSSATKIHQICKRLRAFFKKAQIPLVLKEKKGSYLLSCRPGKEVEFAFDSGQKNKIKSGEQMEINKFIQQMKSSPKNFTAQDWQEKMGGSARTARRRLQSFVKLGMIKGGGRGRSVRYSL